MMKFTGTRAEMREATQRRRRPPGEPLQVRVAFADGDLGEAASVGPVALSIEATNALGAVAGWFDDLWWMDVLHRWGDCIVTIQMLPTPVALLHPVTLHHMEMVGRVAPRWRLIGQAYADDIRTDEDIVTLAKSPYHEVRFFDQPRSASAGLDRAGGAMPIEELFGRIRREQRRMDAVRPILTRMPARKTEAGSSSAPAQMTSGRTAT